MKKITKTLSIWFADKPKTLIAKTIYWFIAGLILYLTTDFIIQLIQPEFYKAHFYILTLIERIIIGIFTLEFIIRLGISKNKQKFIGNIYNIFDFIVIVSSFFAAFNFAILRTIRFIRILRMLRLLRLHRLITTNSIVKENLIKNIAVIFVIIFIANPLHDFILSVPKDVLGDVLFASSILVLAAMFGAFSYSYKDINPSKLFERIFAHLTTGMLMIPIGVMFLIIQFVLNLKIGFSSLLLNISIWFVYASIVLWDFANSLRARRSN